MARCTPISITRALPAWVVLCLLAAVSAAALLAACGGSGGGSSPTPTATVTVTATPSASSSPTTAPTATPTPTTALSLYFLRDGELGVAQRRVPQTTMPATAALRALLKDPSPGERAAGLSSAIPAGTKLRSLALSQGIATVNLSQAPDPSSSGDTIGMPGTAELAYTLTRFSTISGVRIEVDGRPWLAADDSGPSRITYRRADFRSLEPAIFVEAPGVGAALGSPFTLAGTASVFEGSFTARLVDGAGHSIVRTQVQASAGAPGRGRFRTKISFSTTAQSGTLIVYSQSMEDGSHQNEVRIPVTFAQE
jgi:Immunoglobulin-like domain of bacterial spore germination/Sporulation and spore germination